MKKRLLFLLLLLAALCLFFSVSSFADVGNINDYGGGDYDGGYDYDDGDYDGGGYGYDSGGNSDGGGIFLIGGVDVGSIGILVLVIALVIFSVLKNKKRGASGMPMSAGSSRIPGNHGAQITAAVQQIDPNFSEAEFLGRAKEIFIALQNAWTDRDWERVRCFETKELYEQHKMQLEEYVRLGRINVIERIAVNQAYLHIYYRDSRSETMRVYMDVRMVDYIKDEKTGAVIKGSPDKDCYMKYMLSFVRKTGVKTITDDEPVVIKCPHCGAPVSVTSAGRCEYCDYIIATDDHGWVLSALEGIGGGAIDERGVVISTDQTSDKSQS